MRKLLGLLRVLLRSLLRILLRLLLGARLLLSFLRRPAALARHSHQLIVALLGIAKLVVGVRHGLLMKLLLKRPLTGLLLLKLILSALIHFLRLLKFL